MYRKLPIVVVLVVALSGFLLFRHVSDVKAATTITVNSTADSSANDGVCTLREAITAANTDTASGVAVGECAAGSGVGDIIEFSIAGAGPHTISPTTVLPTITQGVIINGYTEPGSVANSAVAPAALNGTLMIEIDGASAGAGAQAFIISGGSTTIRGLAINGFSDDAIQMHSNGGNTFEGNYIGTNIAGTAADGNGNNGINTGQMPNITIGGTDPEDRNLISGNASNGIIITGESSDSAIVRGNIIGLNAAGTADLGNGGSGVIINSDADNASIGGTATGSANIISGNNGVGVGIDGSSTTGHTVSGNYIGVGANGSTDLGNTSYGVILSGSTNTNTVGGTTASARNIISGNDDNGIRINTSSSSNTVSGNYIGTSSAGNVDVGNTAEGIAILNAGLGNVIGGSVSGAGNVISGNNADGIIVFGTTGITISGNIVGLDSAGTTALGNSSSGIALNSGTTGSTVGGDTSAERNVVSGNSNDGIALNNADDNTISGNYIGTDSTGGVGLGNTDEGIYLESGSSGNYVGGDTSGERNVISGNNSDGVFLTGASTTSNTVAGNYIGTDTSGDVDLGNTDDGLEIASASNFIGGNTSSARNVISGNDNDGIFLTGTSASLNTVSGNYIGTNAAGTADLGNTDDGIEIGGGAASNTIGGDTAADRNIISGNNEHGIVVGDAAASSIVIRANYIGTSADGSVDLGNSGNGIVTFNSAPAITIGGATSGMGNVISGNATHGIALASTSTSSTIQGNIIGLDAGGTLDRGNDNDGIETSAASTTIGGNTSDSRNIISGNGDDGIALTSTGTASTIRGNYIGTNAAGTAAVGNTSDGIYTDASDVVVGGVDSGQRNIISGNGVDGISIPSSVTGITIRGNYIGTSADGMSDLGNTTDGIEGYNMTVGGTTSGSRNIISGNNGRGVAAAGGSTIQGNYIGLNVAGTAALPNGNGNNAAVNIGGNNNTLGGTTAAARNVISGNSTAPGVIIIGLTAFGGGSSSNNIVQGNYIGTNTNGEVQPGFGNDLGMVILLDSLNSLVGGTAAGTGNIIAGNGAGIASFGISGAGLLPLNNSFLGNSIYSNNGGSFQGLGINLGIDLFDNPTGDFTTFVNVGVNANDAGDPDTPANRYMNYPVISSVASDNGQATVTYSLDINDAEVGATGYRVEFFANDSADPSGYGQGQTYLGATTVAGDVTNAVANLTLPAGVSGAKYITAVTTMTDNSTDGFGHSSEFSANVLAVLEAAGGSGGGSGSGSVNLADTGNTVLLITAIAVASVTLGLYISRRRKVYTISGR